MIIRHDRIRNFNAVDFHRLIEVSRFAFYGFKAFGFGLLPCRLYAMYVLSIKRFDGFHVLALPAKIDKLVGDFLSSHL